MGNSGSAGGSFHSSTAAVWTIAMMPALIASGKPGHASMIVPNRGSYVAFCASGAPDSAPLWQEIAVFPQFSGVVRIPPHPLSPFAATRLSDPPSMMTRFAKAAAVGLIVAIAVAAGRAARSAGANAPDRVQETESSARSVACFDGRLVLCLHRYFQQPSTRARLWELGDTGQSVRVKGQLLGSP